MEDQVHSSAGEQLKNIRTQRNLSLQEVSNQLKVSIDRLQQIEDDTYPPQGLDIYYRGHIRNYCHYLNIESEPIFEQLIAQGFILYPEKKTPPSTPMPQLPTRLSLNSLLAAATVLIVILLWWAQTHRHLDKTPPPLPKPFDTATVYEHPTEH